MNLLEWKKQIEKDEGVNVDASWKMIQAIDKAGMLRVKEIDDKCLILYSILTELNQEKSLTELLIYTKKEYRGDIRLLHKIKIFFDKEASDEDCDCVRIGANFGYKDDSFSRLLERWGYVPDVYRKERK